MKYYAGHYDSPVGKMRLAADENNLVGLWLTGQKYFGQGAPGELAEKDDLPVFQAARKWLNSYFAGEKPAAAELPLAPRGSEFRQIVWRILGEIPYGECLTYGQIAKRVAAETGRPGMSAQAVGGAVGHNPISVIIPCHRVVGASGSLTGYAGGLAVKIRLLELEGVDLANFFTPEKGSAL